VLPGPDATVGVDLCLIAIAVTISGRALAELIVGPIRRPNLADSRLRERGHHVNDEQQSTGVACDGTLYQPFGEAAVCLL
jgi:hypothetical protein